MLKKMLLIFTFSLILPAHLYARGQERAPFRFAVMGCMHLGICGSEDLDSAMQRIKEYNPDLLLLLGGMVDTGSRETVESLWRKFDQAAGALGVPCYDVPGDCSLISLSVSDKRMESMNRCFLDRYKKYYYAFEHKNNLFIGVDSARLNSREEAPYREQLDFLKDQLADASRYDNVFVFMHDSPWLTRNNLWLEEVYGLFEGKVKFVFGARRHYLDAVRIGDATYITTGTPPCYAKTHRYRPSFPNFLLVEVGKEKVSVEVVPIGPFSLERLGVFRDPEPEEGERSHKVIRPHLLSAHEREVILAPERVVKALNIREGMDILDIGAGSGFFAFRFADALKGTGRVFATEIDQDLLKQMEERKDKDGYKNIFPVLVQSQGLDPFYRQQSFDLVFMSDTYHYFRSPADYFRQLAPSIKKGGRVYIIHNRNIYDFTEIELGDPNNIIELLSCEDEEFPLIQRLDKDVRYFIDNRNGKDVPAQIRGKIVENFNETLLDRRFFHDLMDYCADKGVVAAEGEWSAPLKYFVANRDIKLAKWLFVRLDSEGVFEDERKRISPGNKERLRQLNRILLCGILKLEAKELQPEGSTVVFVEKDSIVAAMARAGYRFVREYDFLPRHYFLEFKKKQ